VCDFRVYVGGCFEGFYCSCYFSNVLVLMMFVGLLSKWYGFFCVVYLDVWYSLKVLTSSGENHVLVEMTHKVHAMLVVLK